MSKGKKKTQRGRAKSRTVQETALVAVGYSAEESKIIVAELAKLARRFGVEGVDQIPAEPMFDLIYEDEEHPLRPFVMRGDVESAARAHWLSETRKLIRCVKIVRLDVPPMGKAEMKLVHVKPSSVVRPMYVSNGRSYVDPTTSQDPDFQRQVSLAYNATKNAVARLGHIVDCRSGRGVWPELSTLLSTLRAAVAEYDGRERDLEHAAEE